MREPIVQLHNISKVINKQTIINDISCSIQQGDVIALCGHNGAGKSTLLKVIVDAVKPTAGEIVWSMSGSHRIGYMPDDFHFHPQLTALETMIFWAKLKGLHKRAAKSVMEQVGLLEVGNQYVSSFSKGMRQRLLFAQALLTKPALLVLDEPTNGLDPVWVEQFIHIIRSCSLDGQTVLMSTHQLDVVEQAANRLMFLQDGEVTVDSHITDLMQAAQTTNLNQLFRERFGIVHSDVL